jgi:hypothetical protein
MRTPLLEILREIPDHRRVEGRRFDLSTVLLYSIIATVGQAVHGSTEMGRPQIPARHLMAEKHGIGGEHVGQAATGKLSSQL